MKIKDKQQVEIEQQFIYTMSKIMEAFPQYTLSQHICHFMRRKAENKEPYFWSDALLLLKITEYYDELTNNLLFDDEDE